MYSKFLKLKYSGQKNKYYPATISKITH